MAEHHLLSLPTEILQSIYLHCFSPDLLHASPLLASALSTDRIYRLTFLHAFWRSPPLIFAGTQAQQAYEPGPYVRALFHPLPVLGSGTDDAQAQMIIQDIVLRYRWCTFYRVRRYFSAIINAVMNDLLFTLRLPLSPHDQSRLEPFIANLPATRSSLELSALNGTSVTLEYPRPFATAILMTYYGPDPRFNQDFSPNLTIAPTNIIAIPAHVLTGKSEWTAENIALLQMLASYVDLHTVHFALSALLEGMRNAVVQGNSDALLVLLWLGTRLAEYRDEDSMSRGDESPFEPPAELFCLVARRGGPALTASDRSEAVFEDTDISVKHFALLLRAHAESMPQHDADISRWAHDILTCQASSEPDRAFAQWVLDWSSRERESEYVFQRRRFGRREGGKVRRPLFRGGGVSRQRRAEGMAMRFLEICGGRVRGFGEEVEGIGVGLGGKGWWRV